MRLMGWMGMISNGIRYFEMKYPINYEAVIKIYQSCRKNLLLFLCCMLFVVGGVYMIIDEDESFRFVIKFIVCWLSLIFFGGVGSFLGVTTLYNTKNRIPYLIIYDDRVEHYVQFKAGYNTIYLADIKSFRLISRPLKSPFLRDVVLTQYLANFLKHATKSFHGSFEVIDRSRQKNVHSISRHTLIKVAA